MEKTKMEKKTHILTEQTYEKHKKTKEKHTKTKENHEENYKKDRSLKDHSLKDHISLKDHSLKDHSLKDHSLKDHISLKDRSLKDHSLKDHSLKDRSLKDHISLKDHSLKDHSLKDRSLKEIRSESLRNLHKKESEHQTHKKSSQKDLEPKRLKVKFLSPKPSELESSIKNHPKDKEINKPKSGYPKESGPEVLKYSVQKQEEEGRRLKKSVHQGIKTSSSKMFDPKESEQHNVKQSFQREHSRGRSSKKSHRNENNLEHPKINQHKDSKQKSNTKPSDKNSSKKRQPTVSESSSSDTFEIDTKGAFQGAIADFKARKKVPFTRRTSESLARDPAYLRRLFGLNRFDPVILQGNPNPAAIESFSPQRRTRFQTMDFEKRPTFHYYAARVPGNTMQFTHRESTEPFPFKMEDPSPRRSVLYHRVDYDSFVRQSTEKPTHSVIPSTYTSNGGLSRSSKENNQRYQEVSSSQGPQVDVQTVTDYDEKPKLDHFEADFGKKVVLRLRPRSSAVAKPKESVRMMVLRADQMEQPPKTFGRFVRSFPLKPDKYKPTFVTENGRLMKPVEIDKERRSVTSEKEENIVRLSVADIKNVRKSSRKSIQEQNQIYILKESPECKMTESATKNEKLESGTIYNNAGSKSLRSNLGGSHFQSSLADNNPIVYTVPLTPSRSTSKRVMYHPVAKQKKHTLDENTGQTFPYSSNTSRYRKRLTGDSYFPGHVKVKKNKPVTVYEVHNFSNELHTKTPSSTTKLEENSKFQRNQSIIKNQNSQGLKNVANSEMPFWERQLIGTQNQNEADNFLMVDSEKRSEKVNGKNQFPKLSFRDDSSRVLNGSQTDDQTKDFCGLTLGIPQIDEFLNTETNLETIPLFQKSEEGNEAVQQFEDDMDCLCFPPKSTTPDPNCRPTYRIIVRKVLENEPQLKLKN